MRLPLAALGALTGAAIPLAPATAFDCVKSETRSEKAICGDAGLKSADDAMAASLEAVLTAAASDQASMIRESQRLWVQRRDSDCDGEAAFAACLLDRTTARTAYLVARPANGPGIMPPLIPRIAARAQSDPLCAADIAVYLFPAKVRSPAAALFDARVDEILSGYESAIGPGAPDYRCSYGAYAEIAYASPDLVNVAISWDLSANVGESDSGLDSIFADLKSGALLAFADVFGDEARSSLIEICTTSLRKQKSARLATGGVTEAEIAAEAATQVEIHAGQIAAAVGDFSRWRITSSGASVGFGLSEIGEPFEGKYDCALPKDLLQRVAGKGGWIVP